MWGVLHVGLGLTLAIQGLDGGLPDDEVAAESLMFFVCAAVIGCVAIAVAVAHNRRNDAFGYWLNLLMGGAVDVAFVIVLLGPGHIDLAGGLSGPLLFVAAAALSTLARVERGGGHTEPPSR